MVCLVGVLKTRSCILLNSLVNWLPFWISGNLVSSLGKNGLVIFKGLEASGSFSKLLFFF